MDNKMRENLFICDNCEKKYIITDDDYVETDKYIMEEFISKCDNCWREYCTKCKESKIFMSNECNVHLVCDGCYYKHWKSCKILRDHIK